MSKLNDLKLLRIFVVTFQKKSVTGASEVLHLSQSSVTRAIQSLEDYLGLSLFTRTANGLVPTEFSCRFYQRAILILDEIEHIHHDVHNLSHEKRVILNIGLGIDCYPIFQSGLHRFLEKEEDYNLNINIASARGLVGNSETKNLDLIIADSTIISGCSWLKTLRTFESKKYIIVREGHPVLKLALDKQFSALKPYPYYTYHLLEDSHGSKIPKPPLIRMNDYMFLLDRIEQTDGYMYVNESTLSLIERFKVKVVAETNFDAMQYSIAYENIERIEALLPYLQQS
ncbi:LysR family transcriptional regulator [Vibrio sp. F74]|uniref:LysR family transcriptional regulator n=1 Tax=Vibrio sp. F74 TaxID=700020 RepID=UPI0035F56D24